MNIEDLYGLYKKSSGVETDTRKIEQGKLFFALRGENFNGNSFAEAALKKGAIAAIVDDPSLTGENIYYFQDSLKALQELAKFHRKQLNIPVIGITGTNGKTTTKELVNAVLSKKYKTYATKGNFNNHIGVPLTLLSIDSNIELAIVEMGANHIGEIEFLCDIANPEYGVITNIGKAHLEGFGSVEGVITAKSELYRHIEANNGTIFINESNPVLSSIKYRGTRVPYMTKESDYFARLDNSSAFLAFDINLEHEYEVRTNLVGGYNLENAVAAIAIGDYFNVDHDSVFDAISEYVPANSRSQMKDTGKNIVICDYYNANPSSMSIAIENFAKTEAENKMLILGDMFELGSSSLEEHIKIIDLVKDNNFDDVLLVGETFKKVSDKYMAVKTVEECNLYLKNTRFKEKLILIKGSRGNRLEEVLQNL